MNRLLILSILLVLGSCVAKKNTVELEFQPSWMKVKPYETGYYSGVGSAKKVGTVNEYTDAAKKDALANLAEEISVQISSTSVLHTIESESGNSQTFDQKIQISAYDYLEGFELMDSYENENSYWVYYRISKIEYRRTKEQKKQEAIELAKTKFIAGKKADESHHAREAITFYLQGMQALNDYLGEETLTVFQGNNIDLGNELYASLNQVLSDLKIIALIDKVKVKRGKIVPQPILFQTLYKSEPENSLLVDFSYSGGYLIKDRDYSDDNGFVKLQPEVINSKKDQENISASIDLDEIAQKAIDNLFIRGLLRNQSIEPAVTTINVLSPNIFLSLAEHYCYNNPCERIRNIFNEIALEEGFNLSAENEPEFIISVSFTFKKGESAGGYYSNYLNGEIDLLDEQHNRLWSKSLKNIKGVGHSPESARDKAFEEFVHNLEHLYFYLAFDSFK